MTSISGEKMVQRLQDDVLVGSWFSARMPGGTSAMSISPDMLWAEEPEIAEALEQLAAKGLLEKLEGGGDIPGPFYRILQSGLMVREHVLHSRGWRKQCLLRQREYSLEDLVVALAMYPRIANRRRTGPYISISEELGSTELTLYLFARDPQEVVGAAEDLAARGLLIPRTGDKERLYVVTSSGEREYAKRIRASLGLKEGETVLDVARVEAFRIFYAWQSDHDPSRQHVGEALERIAAQANDTWKLVVPIIVELATDPGDGAVRIDAMLMEKIAHADVVVADVTPVIRYENRLIPNPNILIEVGYALAGKEANQLILVEHFAKTQTWLADYPGAKLPFDIDHVHRIKYDAPNNLQAQLERELRINLERRGYVNG